MQNETLETPENWRWQQKSNNKRNLRHNLGRDDYDGDNNSTDNEIK
jgi:hypothetical protein